MDDQELQRTEQGSVSIHVAVPNTATILDALALVPEVYFAVLGFSSVQFSRSVVTGSLQHHSACRASL